MSIKIKMSLFGSIKSTLVKANASARVLNNITKVSNRNLSSNIQKSNIILLSPKINNTLLNNVLHRQVQTAG